MKKVRLNDLEENKNNLLKQYKLDKDSIKEFRSKIKQVSDEESKKLFFDLYDLITSKEFYDDYLKVTELIYNGAIVNYYSKNYDLFDICIRNNYIKTIIVLLRTGLDIGAFNFNQMSPIMLCTKVGNKEILELLILMGADVNLKNEYGDTALSIALKNNHKECVDILVNSQSHLNLRNISNDSIIDTNKSSNLIPTLLDKSVYPTEEIESCESLIVDAETKLNNLEINIDNFNECKMNILPEEKIYGYNQLEIFEKYGTRASITDFAILLGGVVSAGYYSKDGDSSVNRTSWWFTNTIINSSVHVVGESGTWSRSFLKARNGGIRPIIPFSYISSNCTYISNFFNIIEVLYGEYPQYVVDLKTECTLETYFSDNILNETGKIYTTDSSSNNFHQEFIPRTFKEYEYNGNKYIRFIGDTNNRTSLLSSGKNIILGTPYWIKVEPISWFVDKSKEIAITKRLLVSGIQLRNKYNYKPGFEHTDMYKFLNEYMIKDIIPSKLYNKQLIKK